MAYQIPKLVSFPPTPRRFVNLLIKALSVPGKASYRRSWLRYICSEYEKEPDRIKTMNVLQAIRTHGKTMSPRQQSIIAG